jgi:hypothetical protein
MSDGWFRHLSSVLVASVVLAACEEPPRPEIPSVGVVEQEAVPLFRYNREYIFVSAGGDPPVIAPFSLSAIDNGVELERQSQGWLARGATWDRFLDESAVTSRVGGVWRVVPQGDLRVIAGGIAEVEGLRFTRAERRLRLDLDDPVSDWNQGGETRFRLLDGRLFVGSEAISGPVLEILRVERMTEDGWPPPEELDAFFLTSGDSLQLVLAESNAEAEPAYAWLRTSEGDQSWAGGEVTRLETRPLDDARRDIPVRWSFQLNEVGLIGEVEASGFDAVLGPERGGRRAVEVRYSVVGWLEVEDARWPVTGMIRHIQR